MNTLKFYPKNIREQYEKNIRNAGIDQSPDKYHNTIFMTVLIITVVISTIFFFINVKIYFVPIVFGSLLFFFYFKVSLTASERIKKMEDVFPEVISLMASNLRSGITIDKAFLLSARPEFDPLDKEIIKTGKDISTGQDIIYALKLMSDRVESEKITKVVRLIISGLKAGGNISDLLEQTSRNMKEKDLLEQKSRSTIFMYVVFIFFAVAVGAPMLFSLSSILVQVIIELTSKLPDVGVTNTNLPFSFNEVSISLNFVIYFSVFFMLISSLISSMVIGLVRKGSEKEGLKYFIPIAILSLSLFFLVRTVLSKTLLESLVANF